MMPVSVCVAMTSTPGNTAPLWSLTVPLICAVAWPQTFAQVTAVSRNTMPRTIKIRFIHPPQVEQVPALRVKGLNFAGDDMPRWRGGQSFPLLLLLLLQCQMLGCPMYDVECICQMTQRPNVTFGLWVV